MGRRTKAVRRAASLAAVAALCVGCAQGVVAKSSKADHRVSHINVTGPLPDVQLVGSSGLVSVAKTAAASVSANLTQLHTPSAELFSGNAPLAMSGPDGVVYSSWTWADPKYATAAELPHQTVVGRPSVWMHTTSGEKLVADGAQSSAVSSTGAIAYVSGGDYRTNTQYVGNIIVRQRNGTTQNWTTKAAAYTVLGWAGQRLLYAVDPFEMQAAGAVYAADARGHSRKVAEADSLLLAVSPDGKWLLFSQGYLQGPPSLKVVETATGRVVTRVAAASIAPGHVIADINAMGAWQPQRIWLSGDADGHASALTIQVRMQNGAPHLAAATVDPIAGLAYTTQVQPWLGRSSRSDDSELVLGVVGSDTSGNYALAVCTVGGGCALRPTSMQLTHQQLEFLH
jgi:hypothetical protein